MRIHDQHLHSENSFDSNEKIQAYLNKTSNKQKYFITTEHKEFRKNSYYQEPTFFKLIQQYEECDSNLIFLKGVELGFHREKIEELNEYVKNNKFDLVLLSIHDLDEIDYIYLSKLNNQAIDNYYNKMIDGINSIDFDVIAHLDYAFRYHNYSFQEMVTPKLIEVLNCIINKDLTLELNSFSFFKNYEFHYFLFNLYYLLGGRNVSLGSDAHRLSDYRYKFKDCLLILKDIGFSYLVYHVKREKTYLDLEEALQDE